MLRYHIQTIEVPSGGTSAITFSNIPQTFDDLELVVSSRNTGANTERDIFLQFNGSTSGYSQRRLYGDGGAAYSDTLTSGADALRVGFASGTNQTANTFGSMKVFIPNYRANSAKSVSSDSVTENNATRAMQSIHAGLWNDVSAINSLNLQLVLSQVFAEHSSASLYGIKRGSDEMTRVLPAAEGGTVTTSGGFTIHTFTSSGTFVANRDLDVEYLVVAGGGGGGYNAGGGGGAGGYRSSVQGQLSGGNSPAEPRSIVLSGSSQAVLVGAGGAGGGFGSTAGNALSGSSSSFAEIVSVGGGRGAGNTLLSASGGSGGGGGFSGIGGAGTSGQGFAGATHNGSSNERGGGGGAGEPGNTDSVGAGGDGIASPISGSSVVRAGGGGGGSTASSSNNVGGDGGGGAGGDAENNPAASSGTANTGGGGGGGASFSVGWAGASGGSGVVIIRYLTPP